MALELVYTSVPKGLRPGARGFCTVAMTAGMPTPLADRLELLSGYASPDCSAQRRPAASPVLYAHWHLEIGPATHSVLTRVAGAGTDYTRRPNKLAHHLVVERYEQAVGGPASVLLRPGVMRAEWSGSPSALPLRSLELTGDELISGARLSPTPAEVTDAARYLADAFMAAPTQPVYVFFAAGTDPLPVIDEAIRLLPAALRWDVTFSTYFTELPAGATCAWRCVPAYSRAAEAAGRHRSARLVGITDACGRAP